MNVAVTTFCIVAMLFPSMAGARTIDWEQIWDQPDIAVIYVDRTTITGSQDLRSISTRTVYKGALPNGYIAERVRTEQFDCKGKRTRLLHVRIIANDSRPAQEFHTPADKAEWSLVETESLGDAKLQAACGRTG